MPAEIPTEVPAELGDACKWKRCIMLPLAQVENNTLAGRSLVSSRHQLLVFTLVHVPSNLTSQPLHPTPPHLTQNSSRHNHSLTTAQYCLLKLLHCRVGNSEFQRLFSWLVGLSYRAVYRFDPIPHKPRPGALLSLQLTAVGSEIFFDGKTAAQMKMPLRSAV